MFRRSVWGLGDQAVSSFSSLLLAVMVARESSPAELGAWAIGYAIYTFLVSLSRAAISTSALISRSPDPEDGAVNVDHAAFTLSFLAGLLAALALVPIGMLLSSELGVILVVFGFGMPALLAQDAIRYVFFRREEIHRSFVIDLVMLVVQIGAGLALVSIFDDPLWITVGWLAAVFSSVCVGWLYTGNMMSLRSAIAFVRLSRSSGGKLLLEGLVTSGTANLMPVFLGGVLGLVSVGHFRGALTLLGVAGIFIGGVTPIATVEVVKRRDSSHFHSKFLVYWCTLVAFLGSVLLVLLLLIPDRFGVSLLGESWYGASAILLPMSLQVILRGPITGVPIVLRAHMALNSVLKLRVQYSAVSLALTLAGAWAFGLSGAAWCWAAGSLIGVVLAVSSYRAFSSAAGGMGAA